MDKRLIIRRGEVTFARKRRDGAVGINISGTIMKIRFGSLLSGKGGIEQSASAGKVSTLVPVPSPPVTTSPAIGNSNNRFSPKLCLSHKPGVYVD